jgi:sedoheptulose-bisphosphatase
VKQVLGSAKLLVGRGKLIDPANIARVFVSPRTRAQQTLKLLIGEDDRAQIDNCKIDTTEEIAEWHYGDYEGLLTQQIRDLRTKAGLDGDSWDIWRDGCEGGE